MEKTMSKAESRHGPTPSQLIDKQIAELGDWRGKMLARLRKLILEAVPTSPRNGSGTPGCGRTTGWFAAPEASRIM